MNVVLNQQEIAVLQKQDPDTKKAEGGFQGLIVDLQKKLDSSTGSLDLNDSDLERIPRYAFDYANGGWQDRLTAIFGRTLGPTLGR